MWREFLSDSNINKPVNMNWDLHPAGLTAVTEELNPSSSQCWPRCTGTGPFGRAPVLQL